MSKAFTRETDGEDEALEPEAPPPAGKNYMTPKGAKALQDELQKLLREERPKVVEIVAWAAGNGDRSENGDYIYGKKRLREIDRRTRYLTKQLRSATIVDPKAQQGLQQVFFGATVTYAAQDDARHTVTLVGIDEADAAAGKISWMSPAARALLKSRSGDMVEIRTPVGTEVIEVLGIAYAVD